MSLGGTRTGFIVDSVSQILKAPAAAIGPAPDLSDAQVRVIKRVVNLEQEGRLVMLLDPAAMLQHGEPILLADPDRDSVARDGSS
jgi:purine-binding chemotaxis protein CheW